MSCQPDPDAVAMAHLEIEEIGQEVGGFAEVLIEEVEGSAIWIKVSLGQASDSGALVEPFVQTVGFGGWIQGWSNGRTLNAAASVGCVPVAVAFIRAQLHRAQEGR